MPKKMAKKQKNSNSLRLFVVLTILLTGAAFVAVKTGRIDLEEIRNRLVSSTSGTINAAFEIAPATGTNHKLCVKLTIPAGNISIASTGSTSTTTSNIPNVIQLRVTARATGSTTGTLAQPLTYTAPAAPWALGTSFTNQNLFGVVRNEVVDLDTSSMVDTNTAFLMAFFDPTQMNGTTPLACFEYTMAPSSSTAGQFTVDDADIKFSLIDPNQAQVLNHDYDVNLASSVPVIFTATGAGTGAGGGGVTAPGAPTTLVATPGAGQVGLTWSAPASNGGAAVTGYSVTYSTNSSMSSPTSSTATTTGATITGLTNGTTYFFQVFATNSAGNGLATTAIPAIPTAGAGGGAIPGTPTNLTATPGNGQVTLSWTAPTGAPTGYTVTYSTTSNMSSPTSSTTPTTGATITGLTNGTTYYFQVFATNTTGAGLATAAVSATPVAAGGGAIPGAPTNLTATPGVGQVSLTWSASATATGYTVIYSTNSSMSSPTSSTATTTGATITGLTGGTTYYFQVFATNTTGNGLATAAVSATPVAAGGGATTGTITVTATGIPQSLSFTLISAPTTTISQTFQLSSAAPAYIQQAAPLSLSYTIALTSQIPAGYTVSPGISQTILANRATPDTSIVFTFAQTSGQATPPAAPASLAATTASQQVTLTWTVPANNGATITGYNIFSSQTDFSATNQGTRYMGSSVSPSGTTISGLTNGTTYRFRIQAMNSAGAGAFSTSVNATPQSSTTPPAAPASLAATTASQQVTLPRPNSLRIVVPPPPVGSGGQTDYSYRTPGTYTAQNFPIRRIWNAREGLPYLIPLQAEGGLPPYTFASATEVLGIGGTTTNPPGMSISRTGSLTFEQSQMKKGRYLFFASVIDARGDVAVEALYLVVERSIGGEEPLAATVISQNREGNVITCNEGSACPIYLTAKYGISPYSLEINGSLPQGLAFQMRGGEFRAESSGSNTFIPVRADRGIYTFSLGVTDDDPVDEQYAETPQLTLTILPPLPTTTAAATTASSTTAAPTTTLTPSIVGGYDPGTTGAPTTTLRPAAPVNNCTFLDVTTRDVNYEAVNFVCRNDIVTGTGSGRMDLYEPTTRAAMAKIVSLIITTRDTVITAFAPFANLSPTAEVSFQDVHVGDWFAPYVQFLLQQGVIDQNDRYRPGETVTNAEAMKMILEAYAKLSPELNREIGRFPSNTWYVPYIRVSQNLRTAISLLAPESTALRVSIVDLIFRASQVYPVQRFR